ncbi:hypothetical protein M427DRAFT_494862 [Gonapodya prolifera JEL478]|uniref:Uncharacterized protein n=1 Tax=Gonapodya prolifera (strain JEL478) TaxID=1344416 RepID=A0A139AJ08_GONPJ|nr:hypothetical protein M427DRAFT_494862 [Gonapodya prolifera JEL478]|eukprot:KXS16718.1 hypothetical protein M427DRAFT_494862 [Gonapodya prolifera JEL478]
MKRFQREEGFGERFQRKPSICQEMALGTRPSYDATQFQPGGWTCTVDFLGSRCTRPLQIIAPTNPISAPYYCGRKHRSLRFLDECKGSASTLGYRLQARVGEQLTPLSLWHGNKKAAKKEAAILAMEFLHRGSVFENRIVGQWNKALLSFAEYLGAARDGEIRQIHEDKVARVLQEMFLQAEFTLISMSTFVFVESKAWLVAAQLVGFLMLRWHLRAELHFSIWDSRFKMKLCLDSTQAQMEAFLNGYLRNSSVPYDAKKWTFTKPPNLLEHILHCLYTLAYPLSMNIRGPHPIHCVQAFAGVERSVPFLGDPVNPYKNFPAFNRGQVWSQIAVTALEWFESLCQAAGVALERRNDVQAEESTFKYGAVQDTSFSSDSFLEILLARCPQNRLPVRFVRFVLNFFDAKGHPCQVSPTVTPPSTPSSPVVAHALGRNVHNILLAAVVVYFHSRGKDIPTLSAPDLARGLLEYLDDVKNAIFDERDPHNAEPVEMSDALAVHLAAGTSRVLEVQMVIG